LPQNNHLKIPQLANHHVNPTKLNQTPTNPPCKCKPKLQAIHRAKGKQNFKQYTMQMQTKLQEYTKEKLGTK
jgi:hypothetical protein